MTYDAWKTTPPEERWPGPGCRGCDERAPYGCDYCDECADQMLAEEAVEQFCEWEPVGFDEVEEQGFSASSRKRSTSSSDLSEVKREIEALEREGGK